MKKIFIILSFLFVLNIQNVFAYTTTNYTTNGQIQYSDLIYSPSKDQYILNYYYSGYANNIKLTFFSAISGNTYVRNWPSESVNKTIFFNCNGIYDVFLRIGEQNQASINDIITTNIVNPVCLSTTPGEDPNDLNTNVSQNDGDYKLNYDDVPGGNKYDLEKSNDGGNTWNVINTNTGSNGDFTIDRSGFYRITAYDINNNIISRDVIGENELNSSKCDGCTLLNQILACPAWDDFMKGFDDLLKNNIPTPSDMGSEIVDQLADQDVTPDAPEIPDPYDPGYPDQPLDLPEKIETDLTPNPDDFKLETTGDGAGPVEISDPAAWTPDNSDKGYVPPDPDEDTAPNYEMEETEETAPDYNSSTTEPETAPNYNITDPPADSLPSYSATSTAGPMPGYNIGPNSTNTIPGYDYE
jgi:hypothetical protein